MKAILKGALLGVSLVLLNKICVQLFEHMALIVWSVVLYFALVCAFLVSKNVKDLLICGFCGLGTMIFCEIILLYGMAYNPTEYDIINGLVSYVGGFWGSMAAIPVAIVLTLKGVSIPLSFEKERISMTHSLGTPIKIKLMVYAAISAISFTYLVTPEKAGVSVPVFMLLQAVLLWFLVPDRKRLLFLIPVGILALHCFVYATEIWRGANFVVALVLYGCMFTDFSFREDSLKFFADIIKRICAPLSFIGLPFGWLAQMSGEKAPIVKRVALALVIAIPCVVILILVLANADMVFLAKTQALVDCLLEAIRLHNVFLVLCGILAGLYLFGLLVSAHVGMPAAARERKEHEGDLIIINILLSAILLVYTMFVVIQFRYLFAGNILPYNLSYTEYARKGFFELLALTGVNIAIIFIVTRLLKNRSGSWKKLTQGLCHYLCAVTVVLLASSFYRMFLYTGDDGLTRLRLFVLGFLAFEAIGLVLTFFYIAKPKFNITLSYLTLALVYYMVLNLAPVDYIIAQNQIDKYVSGQREDVSYIYTLSADAAPAMAYLYEHPQKEEDKQDIERFLERIDKPEIPQRWQRYNLSVEYAKSIRAGM